MTGAVDFDELTVGTWHGILSARRGPDLAARGYTEAEYSARGEATRFAWSGNGGTDAVEVAPFITRVLVRRPAQSADFNGCVVAEWLNVSSGSDAAPEYTYLADELVRSGYAWVGVSTQYAGVQGGAEAAGRDPIAPPAGESGTSMSGRGLVARDPVRYDELSHPGDGYSYDIFRLIGAALARGSGTSHPFAGLRVDTMIGVGESQSAMALTTYATLFAGSDAVFDGLLIHSRPVGALPLGASGTAVDIAGAYSGEPVAIPDNLTARVLVVQTETDVLTDFDYVRARQPDSDRLRTWEIAGTSHADHFQIGDYEEMLGCESPVNRGQQRFVLRAALRQLHSWAQGGSPPPTAPPLEVDLSVTPPQYRHDALGNVRGGVRSPCVDAPSQVLSGVVNGSASRICVLFGTTTPIPDDVLRELWPDEATYRDRYAAATEEMIAAGFAVVEDRSEIIADARPDLVVAAVNSG